MCKCRVQWKELQRPNWCLDLHVPAGSRKPLQTSIRGTQEQSAQGRLSGAEGRRRTKSLHISIGVL